jgi:hypothetical protein
MSSAQFELDTDTPCGRAKDPAALAADHFRLFMPADYDYMAYWCVRLRRTGGEAVCRVDVLPDPAYAGRRDEQGVAWSYKARIGCPLCICRDGRWDRVLLADEPDGPAGLAARWLPERLEMKVRLSPGEQVVLCSTIPWPHEQAADFLRQTAARRPDLARLETIGRSIEGRAILGLSIGEASLPAVLVVAGEHATEFAGQHAVRGIARFLAGDEPAAAALRGRLRFLIAPQVNPDGNAHGWLKFNAAGANLCESYSEQALADAARLPENLAVLAWADAARPVLVLNFHGGTWRVGNPPYHWATRTPPELHPSDLGARRQRAVDAAVVERTDGVSRSGRLVDSSGHCIHNRISAERWQAAGVCYEPELNDGVADCMRTGVRVIQATAEAILGTL